MSGLINSAGSKSGVIGTTELAYEEGRWTPSFAGSGWSDEGITSTRVCHYVRLGPVVNFWIDIFHSDNIMDWTNASQIHGLPTFSGVQTNFHGPISAEAFYTGGTMEEISGYVNSDGEIYLHQGATNVRHFWIRGSYKLAVGTA